MTRLTVAERRERIAEDDGPLDATVHFLKNNWRRTGVYHATPECSQLTAGKLREDTRARAQELDRAPCKVCVLDGGGPPDTIEWECPFCGDDAPKPSAHLPCDGSEGAAEVDGA